MTVCCAAKFHPAKPKTGLVGSPGFARRGFLARGGSARKKNLPLIPLMTLSYTDLNGTGRTAIGICMGEKFMVATLSRTSLNMENNEGNWRTKKVVAFVLYSCYKVAIPFRLLCSRVQCTSVAEARGSDQLYRRFKDLLHPVVGHSKA
jgi:hypothetical protein